VATYTRARKRPAGFRFPYPEEAGLRRILLGMLEAKWLIECLIALVSLDRAEPHPIPAHSRTNRVKALPIRAIPGHKKIFWVVSLRFDQNH
jgi:hypothetical protein